MRSEGEGASPRPPHTISGLNAGTDQPAHFMPLGQASSSATPTHWPEPVSTQGQQETPAEQRVAADAEDTSNTADTAASLLQASCANSLPHTADSSRIGTQAHGRPFADRMWHPVHTDDSRTVHPSRWLTWLLTGHLAWLHAARGMCAPNADHISSSCLGLTLWRAPPSPPPARMRQEQERLGDAAMVSIRRQLRQRRVTVQALWAMMDTDRGGVVHFAEFINGLSMVSGATPLY